MSDKITPINEVFIPPDRAFIEQSLDNPETYTLSISIDEVIDTPEPKKEKSKKRAAGPGEVVVFDLDKIRNAYDNLGSGKDTALTRKFCEQAAKNGGIRELPKFDKERYMAGLDELYCNFPNFHSVIEYFACELIMAVTGDTHKWRIHPVLLEGVPGIGKTHFCDALARFIGTDFYSIQCGSLQGSFDLAGSSMHWSNTRPGRIFTYLAQGDTAAPLILLDEIDKISGEAKFDPNGALHDLLEADSAARFVDESIDTAFNAYHAILIATTNEIGSIAPAVKSRMTVLKVEAPTLEQRKVIARNIIDGEIGNRSLDLREEAIDRIVAVESDLRAVRKMARQAVATALIARSSYVGYEHVKFRTGDNKTRIGFL